MWTLAAPLLAADGLDALAAAWPRARRARRVVRALRSSPSRSSSASPSAPKIRRRRVAAADAHPAAVEWLRYRGRPGRATNDVHLGNAFHNMGLRWSFESAGGYHSLPIWRYLHLLWIANHGAPYPRAQLGDDLTGAGAVALLVAHRQPARRGVGRRAARSPDRRAAAGRAPSPASDGVDVWHNRDAFPRAFVVYAAEHVADEAAAARAVAAPTWDPSHSVVVEEELGLPPPSAPLRATTPTQLIREGANAFVVEVAVARPGHPRRR